MPNIKQGEARHQQNNGVNRFLAFINNLIRWLSLVSRAENDSTKTLWKSSQQSRVGVLIIDWVLYQQF